VQAVNKQQLSQGQKSARNNLLWGFDVLQIPLIPVFAVVTRFQRNRDSTQKQETQACGTTNRLPAGVVLV